MRTLIMLVIVLGCAPVAIVGFLTNWILTGWGLGAQSFSYLVKYGKREH